MDSQPHCSHSAYKKRFALFCILCFFLFPYTSNASVALNIHEVHNIVSKIKTTYGDVAYQRANSWIELVAQTRGKDLHTQVREVNDFFNAMTFIHDTKLWGQEDYWASLAEFIGAGGGDCEDFTLAKFYTLVHLGIRPNQLQITYVNTAENQAAHMILAYRHSPDEEPLILDNIEKKMLTASQRTDLEPVYAFNVDQLWLTDELGQGQLVGTANVIKPWVRVMKSTRSLTMAIPITNLDEDMK